MDKKQLEILTNIIGGVESGGQEYGQRRYEAYAGKRANSANEKTCTLGWAQNYGNEARKLCQMILKEDPGAFRGADTAGIESRLSQDWEAIGWNPSATEKAALIAIITTPSGKKCQDELFEQLMETYIKQAVAYGVNTVPAQMMWCEIEHLGGPKPTKRIFGRAAKPYTPDSVYASLILDQQDTSNNNQVGDKMYQSRHQCCVKWIKQYVGEEKESAGMTENELRQMVANNMRGWIGLKRSDRSHISAADENNLQISSGKSGFFVLYTGNIIEIIGLLPDQSLINSISETTRLYRKKVIVNSYIEFSVAFQMYKNGITIRELFLLISFCE